MSTSGRYCHLDGREEDDDDITASNVIDNENNGVQFIELEDQQQDEFADEAFVEHEDLHGANADNGDDRPSTNSTKTNTSTLYLGIVTSLGFCATYFWRYPIFMLPPDILATPVVTVPNIFGNASVTSTITLDLQSSFSLAYIGGMGSAKFMGMRLIASDFFFRHRLAVICALAIFTMLTECVGVWAFASIPPLQVASVFASSFVNSWTYGAVLTYIEGREATETLLAIMGLFFIDAGGAARGAATMALNAGVPPLLMPLTLGMIACPISCFMMYLTDRCPKPSAADLASRCERSPISPSDQRKFLSTYAIGMAAIYISYAILTGLRSFRDFYAEQIYTAALQDEPAAWIFIVADLPGAILASAVLYSFKSQQEHGAALQAMLCTCVGAGALILMATSMFAANVISGLLWQMTLGVGLYVAYNILTSAVYDRIVAATNTEGTCTFLVFLGDCFGYVVTFAILLLRDFGSSSSGSASDDDRTSDEDAILGVFLTFVYLGIGVSLGCLLAARCYFWKRLREDDNASSELEVVRLAEHLGDHVMA